jgi:hypothetical protein
LETRAVSEQKAAGAASIGVFNQKESTKRLLVEFWVKSLISGAMQLIRQLRSIMRALSMGP